MRSALARSQLTAPRRREAVMHFPSDVAPEAASELQFSRLLRPAAFEKGTYSQRVNRVGHAVPSKRSSPPAEKWAVCIGALWRSQGKSPKIAKNRGFRPSEGVT